MDATRAAQRVAASLLSLLASYTVAFLAVAYTPNPNQYVSGSARIPEMEPSPARALAARSEPLVSLYVSRLVDTVTLQFGRVGGPESAQIGPLLAETLFTTGTYLLPAVAVAVVGGTAIQLYAVARNRGQSRRLALVAALLVSVPVFVYAELSLHPALISALGQDILDAGYDLTRGPFAPANLRASLRPFLVMSVFLLAIQLRRSGTAIAERIDEPFVRTARAKGAGPVRVARHLFPHVAARVLTTLFTDNFGLVLVGVYVTEWLTNTPGFGTLTIDAVVTRQTSVIFVVVLVPVVIAVVVNLLQDLYVALFDPRTDEESVTL